MNMNKIILLIIGMAVVTYIPRFLPFKVVSGEKLPKRVRRFLTFIPCTALGALIIPGVFSATPGAVHASVLGIAFALIYAWFRGGIIIPVLGSILVTFGVLLIK